jgi:hypothetical protein
LSSSNRNLIFILQTMSFHSLCACILSPFIIPLPPDVALGNNGILLSRHPREGERGEKDTDGRRSLQRVETTRTSTSPSGRRPRLYLVPRDEEVAVGDAGEKATVGEIRPPRGPAPRPRRLGQGSQILGWIREEEDVPAGGGRASSSSTADGGSRGAVGPASVHGARPAATAML